MSGPVPRYVDPAALPASRILGVVRFDGRVSLEDHELTLALPPHGPQSAEVWIAEDEVRHGACGALQFATSGGYLFGAIVDDDPDVECAARRSYERIVPTLRAQNHPFLLRVWNHVRDINGGEGDCEPYKRFCAGRYDALTAAGYEKPDFPAASAVGMRAGSLAIYFIASTKPGTNIENPRQMSAYDYPRQYGHRSPSFARATVAGETAFISGTASVVGHETVHAGDVEAQTSETLANLSRVLAVCGARESRVEAVKVYVRRCGDVAFIAETFAGAFPAAERLVVESDICRRDLLLEAEAIARV